MIPRSEALRKKKGRSWWTGPSCLHPEWGLGYQRSLPWQPAVWQVPPE